MGLTNRSTPTELSTNICSHPFKACAIYARSNNSPSHLPSIHSAQFPFSAPLRVAVSALLFCLLCLCTRVLLHAATERKRCSAWLLIIIMITISDVTVTREQYYVLPAIVLLVGRSRSHTEGCLNYRAKDPVNWAWEDAFQSAIIQKLSRKLTNRGDCRQMRVRELSHIFSQHPASRFSEWGAGVNSTHTAKALHWLRKEAFDMQKSFNIQAKNSVLCI